MATIILLTGMSLLSLNMYLPALAEMAASFEVSYATMNLSLGGYLAVAAVMQLLFGPLSDRYGRRPIFLISTILFALVSIGGFFAQDFWVFFVFRLLQSAIVAGMVLGRAVIRDTSSHEEAASLLGYVAMVMALAPMLGPLAGGFMADLWGWRSIYALYSVLGVFCIWLIWSDVGETNRAKSKSFTDQFRQYPELFRSRRFWGYTVVLTFAIGAFHAFISGAPLVAKRLFEVSPAALGAGIGSISFGFMFGNVVSGRFTKRIGIRKMMSAGRYFGVAGPLLGLILAFGGVANVWVYFGCILGVGFGNGLTLPAANAGVMSVRPHLAGSASGVSGAISIAGGAVLTIGTGWILTLWQPLVGHLTIITLCSFIAMLGIAYVNRIDQLEGAIHGEK